MNTDDLLKRLTFEEKVSLLTGTGRMSTCGVERLSISEKKMADGPHGVRAGAEENCVSFPNLCSLGASWDVETAYLTGEALAEECMAQGVELLLGPGINIKRHILCGRNFEYFSEDPLIAGELAAAYISGMQDRGVGACLKHFACNNQEENRIDVSVEADMRTLREIYLKGFEIAVKKAKPWAVMCAYNRVNAVWCSENRFLLTDLLKREWGYEGMAVSDWGAVHDTGRAVAAGLDLQMPENSGIVEEMRTALKQGKVTEEEIHEAVRRVLDFAGKESPRSASYDRKKQHETARRTAAAGIVLLKNEENVLPLTAEKYRKIAVAGEFAVSPNISGQGSAEVNVRPEEIDSPLEELRKLLSPEVELCYREMYKKREYSDTMLWPRCGEFREFIGDCDAVILFIGSMVSEDTEYFDRRSAFFNPNYELFINTARNAGKKVIVVMQTGGAMILGSWQERVQGIVQMWLGGESAGGAVADILTGRVNPSGRLPETFPKVMRRDLEYPGEDNVVEYRERCEVGYRYYDRHPEEILYPFGHGLSYSRFAYEDMRAEQEGDTVRVSLLLRNESEADGHEIVQIYTGSRNAGVRRPLKELRAFRKVFVKAGETVTVEIVLKEQDFAFYNVTLNRWVTEAGQYVIYAGASSRDIRCMAEVSLEGDAGYTLMRKGNDMIG